jgi:hypothetical protein
MCLSKQILIAITTAGRVGASTALSRDTARRQRAQSARIPRHRRAGSHRAPPRRPAAIAVQHRAIRRRRRADSCRQRLGAPASRRRAAAVGIRGVASRAVCCAMAIGVVAATLDDLCACLHATRVRCFTCSLCMLV